MAGTVKGITIEFNGDTTRLQKALKDVRKETRDIDKELGYINKGLKFDATNVDMWKQKQVVLKEAIKSTESNLKSLKDAQAQLDAQGIDRTSAEYRELEREIIKTEDKLKNFKAELKQVSFPGLQALSEKFKEIGDKMQEVGGKVEAFGTGMSKYVTAPITAVGAAATKAFNDVDEGMDIIVKKTGATGDALADMEDRAKSIATSIPTSFDTAGSAIGEVNTRFGLTGDELEDLSVKFIKFAELNGTDVSSSIDSVQSAMAAFGLDAQYAGHYLDTLNKAGQDTGVSVDKLAQDMTANAASLKEMGFNASDSAHFLANLSKNGIDTSTVMTGLRKAFVNGAKDGKSMEETLAELQESMKNADTDTEAYAAAMELFGNKAGPAMAQAIKEGRLELDGLGTTLDDALGNIDTTFESTLDPIDNWKIVLNQAKEVGADLGGTLGEMLLPVIQKVSEVVQKLREKWEGLTPEEQEQIIKIAGIVAAVGPLIAVLGKVISIGGSLMKVLSVIAANPIILVIGAIVAAGVLLWKNWDKIKAKAQELWAKVKPIFDKIKNFIVGSMERTREQTLKAWNAIKNGVTQSIENTKAIITNVFNAINNFMNNHMAGVKNVIVTVWNSIKAVFQSVLGVIKALVSGDMNAIKASIVNVWNTIKTSISNILNAIKQVFANIFSGIKNAVINQMSQTRDQTLAIWNAIKTAASTVWNGIRDTVSNIASGIKNNVQNNWNNMKSGATTAFNAVKNAIVNNLQNTKNTVSTIVNAIKNFFNFDNLKSKISSAFESIKSSITSPLEKAKTTVQGVIDKIKSIFPIKLGKIFSGIKLPHFNISGGVAPWGIGGKGTKPSISIDWYAKGGIFKRPTIFATGSSWKGVGEAGAEAVVPLDTLWQHMEDMGKAIVAGVAATTPQLTGDEVYRAMSAAMKEMSFSIGEREFARILREYGAIT